jgi:hypothetical protein
VPQPTRAASERRREGSAPDRRNGNDRRADARRAKFSKEFQAFPNFSKDFQAFSKLFPRISKHFPWRF